MQQHPSIIAGPLLALLLLFSCSSGEEILKEEIPPVQPEEKIAVSFSGRIDLVETKAGDEGTPETPGETATTQTLRKNVNVTIRAYKQAEAGSVGATPQDCRDYIAGGDGSLTVKGGGEGMLLAAGTYTFYALSVNAAGDVRKSLCFQPPHKVAVLLPADKGFLFFSFRALAAAFNGVLVLAHQGNALCKECFFWRMTLAAVEQTICPIIIHCVFGHPGNRLFQNLLNRFYRLSPSTKV